MEHREPDEPDEHAVIHGPWHTTRAEHDTYHQQADGHRYPAYVLNPLGSWAATYWCNSCRTGVIDTR